MEYKIRYIQKKKTAKIKRREDAGYIRVKIRGRKRWVKTTPPAEEKKAN